MKNMKDYALGISLFLASLFFLVIIVKSPVRNVMEARNFRASEEILETGNWLFPTLNGAPRVVKPPLPTWASALCAKIFGDSRNIFALRLPNLIVGILLVWFVFLLAKDIAGKQSAFFSTWIFVTSVPLIAEIGISRWDLFATSFGLGSVWSTCRMLQRGKVGYFFLSLVFFIASYLSKGPILLALYIPFFLSMGILSWKFSEEKNADSSFAVFFPNGWKKWTAFVFLVILGILGGHSWWFASQIHYSGTWNTLYSDVTTLHSRHGEPFYYYLLQLPALMAPWTLILFLALVLSVKEIYASWSKKIKDHSLNKALFFGFLWFIIGLTMLSFFGAKKNRYFFPVSPSCCIFLGIFCEFLAMNGGIFQKEKLVQYTIFLQLWIHKIFLLLFPLAVFGLVWYQIPWYFILPAIPFGIAGFAFKTKQSIFQLVLFFSLTVMITTMLLFFAIEHSDFAQEEYEGAGAVKEITKGFPLYMFQKQNDSLLWAMGRNYIYFEKIEDLATTKEIYILTEATREKALQELLQSRKISIEKVYSFHENEKKKKLIWNLWKSK
ncbi:MAG: glycosyltransferase family 39 protein [Candidatus Brocadiae bacterium]|nr:glycosyltransferase family 39 protein [Candidatus Brocadiia bacterium]